MRIAWWWYAIDIIRDHFVNVPSQWETVLHCNIVSHWLGIHKMADKANSIFENSRSKSWPRWSHLGSRIKSIHLLFVSCKKMKIKNLKISSEVITGTKVCGWHKQWRKNQYKKHKVTPGTQGDLIIFQHWELSAVSSVLGDNGKYPGKVSYELSHICIPSLFMFYSCLLLHVFPVFPTKVNKTLRIPSLGVTQWLRWSHKYHQFCLPFRKVQEKNVQLIGFIILS